MAAQSCAHCGTRYRPSAPEERFCCSGCEYVYRVIHDEGLERYYSLKGEATQPVGSSLFCDADFTWLQEFEDRAVARDGRLERSFALEGVSCVACLWLVDRLFAESPGGSYCRVNLQTGSVDLSWSPGEFDLIGFARRLHRFGYRLRPERPAGTGTGETGRLAWRLGLCAAFSLNGMLYALPVYLGMESDFAFAPHFGWLSALFATLSMGIGGSYFMARAFKAALRGIVHLDLPISLGVAAAYLASWYGKFTGDLGLVYFEFVSTFIFLMLAGRWVQTAAVERNRNRLSDGFSVAPVVDRETADGGYERITSEQMEAGDCYWLAPGQKTPTRSILLDTRASFAMDWISGESESRIVEAGGEASSGAALENAEAVRLQSLEAWSDSLLAKLARAKPRGRERDDAAQRWIFWYMSTVSGVAIIGALAWWSFGSFQEGLMVLIAALVVSCPCAIGVAWPFADELALGRLRALGLFVTTHAVWNRLGRTRRVVFDKTGTLTRGSLTLLNPGELDRLGMEDRRALATLCRRSRHPAARALRERLMSRGGFVETTEAPAQETVGLGVEAIVEGRRWRLGRAEWACREGVPAHTALSCDGELRADFRFGDEPLPDALRETAHLRRSGLRLAILSGDRQDKAERIGAMLGFDAGSAHGGMQPEDKAAWLQANGAEETLMVGDGANDALAFQAALCCGAPANEQGILAERADFHYLGNGIEGIGKLFAIARRRSTAMRRLLVFAIAYNVLVLGLALAGLMQPLLAAILMPASSIISLAIVWRTLGRQTK